MGLFPNFYHIKPKGEANGELVILVHGLFVRGLIMYPIGRYLSRKGYEVFIYDYFTTRKNIRFHGMDFSKYLKKMIERFPEKKINIVTHSLGGIITREALNITGKLEPVKRIVMLTPPNKGSDIAKNTVKFLPFSKYLVRPLLELSSEKDAYVHSMSVPDWLEIGVIAAGFDNKVALEYTFLNGHYSHIVIPSGHTRIVFNRLCKEKIFEFLSKGKF